jgi:hypothetical protein
LPGSRPSPETLLAAAVAGLFGLSGCPASDPSDEPIQCPEPTGPTNTGDTSEPTTPTPTGPTILSSEENLTITFAEFSSMCLDRGGLMQTHATCAGNNACTGFHFNKNSKMFTEHTCKAMNSCGGISCVVLPEDQGRTGEDIYRSACGPACHGGTDTFQLWIWPGADPDEALLKFQEHTTDYFIHMLAFGSSGMNESGTAYANVPARHETHSREELIRVIEHIRTLPTTPIEFTILGETEDLN